MDVSMHRRPAWVNAVGYRVSRRLIAMRDIALCTLFLLANTATVAMAETAYSGIHVNILDIRNSTGKVACALFDSAEGFPAEFVESATNITMLEIRDTVARCHFLEIPPGSYALAVIHDENLNGKLDTNWAGVPTEGYGFSNDAQAAMSAPSFEAARFTYDGQNLDMTIRLNY